MDDSVNDTNSLVNEIFGQSDDDFEFDGFHREELGQFSDLEVEEYDESSGIDTDGENETEEEMEVQAAVTPQEWTKNFTETNILPFSVQNPGATSVMDAEKEEINFFELIFTDEIYEILVRETNLYAQQKIAVKPDPKWRAVTKEEIKAYLGIRMYMSIVKLPETRMYWAKDIFFGNFGICTVMTRDRFDKISQYFHTNDRSSIPLNARGKPIDKLYLVRRVLDIIQNQIQNNYIPYQNVSVDEAMIAFRGRLSFRQYLPAKPTKYGIKVWEVCDSRNGYCFDFDVYLGRPTGPGGNETREVELGKKTVLKLTEKLRNKNYHVYFDNYFTGVPLLEELLQRGTYGCGTMRINRKGLPQDLRPATKSKKGEENAPCFAKTKKEHLKKSGDTVMFQKGQVSVVAWMEKKGRKPVVIASTTTSPTSPPVTVSRRKNDGTTTDVPCPRSVKEYNENMGGVDRNDALRVEYPTARMTRRWWLYLFYFLFDLAVANSFILMKESANHKIYKKNGAEKSRKLLNYRMNLSKQLIGNYRESRKKRSWEPDTQATAVEHWPLSTPTKRTCKNCKKNRLPGEKRASSSRVKCAGCSTEKGDTNLCIDCFKDFHKDH